MWFAFHSWPIRNCWSWALYRLTTSLHLDSDKPDCGRYNKIPLCSDTTQLHELHCTHEYNAQ